MKTSITPFTSGQGDRIAQLVKDELKSLGVDKWSAQQIIASGGDLQAYMRDKIIELGKMRYRDEEVESNYGYPAGYKEPKPICEQLLILAKHFPSVDTAPALAYSKLLPKLPNGADGYFAMLYWDAITKTYNEAVEKMLAALSKSREGKFYNYLAGKLGEKHLRQREQSIKMWAEIRRKQKGDIAIVPAQLGLLHRGRSTRRAREVFENNEFGAGLFHGGCMLLTHPERLSTGNELWIDFAGDEYFFGADGDFSGAPYLGFNGGGVRLSAYFVDYANSYYGSASVFLPQ